MPAPPEHWSTRLLPGQHVVAQPVALLVQPGERAQPLRVLSESRGSCDTGQPARRTCTLVVSSRDLPARVDARARVLVSVAMQRSAGMWDAPAVLTGGLGMAPVDAEPGVVRIDVASPEDVLDGHGFTVPRTLTGTALGSLTGLVAESLPGERVAASGLRDMPIGRMDVDAGDSGVRLATVRKLASMLGCDFGAGAGGDLRLAPVDARERPTWVLRQGVHFGAAPSLVLPPQPNVVRVEAPDARPDQWALAVDDRPGSPGYVGAAAVQAYLARPSLDLPATLGAAPIRTRTYQMPVQSWPDAAFVARTLLLRGDRDADVSLDVPWNPWLDWGDRLVLMLTDGSALSLVVTSFPLPLIPTPVMTVAARLE